MSRIAHPGHLVLFSAAREVIMADEDSTPPAQDPSGGGRRQADRRGADMPVADPDRRAAPREDAHD
ncbi:hypothetical protein [Erythrobacter sp.]|uniref:hypothetical protein n=1 Tax=Erythrobacter sp. TaxID=1042 RepID=UPI0026001691|nr:hypothetical protein [Erythrobacter sp.]